MLPQGCGLGRSGIEPEDLYCEAPSVILLSAWPEAPQNPTSSKIPSDTHTLPDAARGLHCLQQATHLPQVSWVPEQLDILLLWPVKPQCQVP